MLIKQWLQALHVEFPNRHTYCGLFAIGSLNHIEIGVLGAVIEAFYFALNPHTFTE